MSCEFVVYEYEEYQELVLIPEAIPNVSFSQCPKSRTFISCFHSPTQALCLRPTSAIRMFDFRNVLCFSLELRPVVFLGGSVLNTLRQSQRSGLLSMAGKSQLCSNSGTSSFDSWASNFQLGNASQFTALHRHSFCFGEGMRLPTGCPKNASTAW